MNKGTVTPTADAIEQVLKPYRLGGKGPTWQIPTFTPTSIEPKPRKRKRSRRPY